MALTNSYLVSTKNLEPMINAVLTAKAPERFSYKFLEGLGFKGSNDRLYINVFKGLGLLDENGVPTDRYYRFLDQSIYKQVLAEGIREAYEDLFNININAQDLTQEEVKNKLKTLTQGQKTDKVISCMAMTFSALCGLADWKVINKKKEEPIIEKKEEKAILEKPVEKSIPDYDRRSKMELHYDIQIHLPETRDEGVYDAIFSSLKKHLF